MVSRIEERNRLSFALVDLHTSQLQAITGTPCEVPEPKTVTLNEFSCILLQFKAKINVF